MITRAQAFTKGTTIVTQPLGANPYPTFLHNNPPVVANARRSRPQLDVIRLLALAGLY